MSDGATSLSPLSAGQSLTVSAQSANRQMRSADATHVYQVLTNDESFPKQYCSVSVITQTTDVSKAALHKFDTDFPAQ